MTFREFVDEVNQEFAQNPPRQYQSSFCDAISKMLDSTGIREKAESLVGGAKISVSPGYMDSTSIQFCVRLKGPILAYAPPMEKIWFLRLKMRRTREANGRYYYRSVSLFFDCDKKQEKEYLREAGSMPAGEYLAQWAGRSLRSQMNGYANQLIRLAEAQAYLQRHGLADFYELKRCVDVLSRELQNADLVAGASEGTLSTNYKVQVPYPMISEAVQANLQGLSSCAWLNDAQKKGLDKALNHLSRQRDINNGGVFYWVLRGRNEDIVSEVEGKPAPGEYLLNLAANARKHEGDLKFGMGARASIVYALENRARPITSTNGKKPAKGLVVGVTSGGQFNFVPFDPQSMYGENACFTKALESLDGKDGDIHAIFVEEPKQG